MERVAASLGSGWPDEDDSGVMSPVGCILGDERSTTSVGVDVAEPNTESVCPPLGTGCESASLNLDGFEALGRGTASDDFSRTAAFSGTTGTEPLGVAEGFAGLEAAPSGCEPRLVTSPLRSISRNCLAFSSSAATSSSLSPPSPPTS